MQRTSIVLASSFYMVTSILLLYNFDQVRKHVSVFVKQLERLSEAGLQIQGYLSLNSLLHDFLLVYDVVDQLFNLF